VWVFNYKFCSGWRTSKSFTELFCFDESKCYALISNKIQRPHCRPHETKESKKSVPTS